MTTLGIAIAVILGFCVGIIHTKRMIALAIRKADTCNDDRRFIRQILGIPEEPQKNLRWHVKR